MRVTNQMMTNNALININKNKVSMSKLEDQYTTGKKIQKPSEDPIVAVRALKLRTNVSEITQYLEKNIPDAKNWMDVTEGALSTISDILNKVNTLCVQGANDPLSTDDRDSIVQNLTQYRDEIYQQGNSDYAGRYVFTGYKTNTSLIFTEDTTDTKYNISETFSGTDIELSKYITNEIDITGTGTTAPSLNQCYRIQLSYDKLDAVTVDAANPGVITSPTFQYGDPSTSVTVTGFSSTDDAAYTFTDTEESVHYIAETGEMLISPALYKKLQTENNIQIDYEKTNFHKGDLRPEHYFDCTATKYDAGGNVVGTPVTYTSSDQAVQYEINYNQKLTVNTQAKDAIKHEIGRTIDEILDAIDAVKVTENKISEVEKKLEDTSLSETDKKKYEDMLDQLNTELTLKNEVLVEKYQNGNKVSKDQQSVVNVANSDLGSRYVRLELVESRLETQSVQVEELMSNNEDVDLAETIIRFSTAQVLYNASLSASAKIVTNTLLDFL